MSSSGAPQDSQVTTQGRQKRGMIYLLIGIPLTSVLLGAVTLYLAFSTTDREVRIQQQEPMSKTSWQESVDDR